MVTPYPLHDEHPVGGVESAAVSLAEGLSALDGMEVHVLRLDRVGLGAASWTRRHVQVRSEPCVERGAAFRGFSLARKIVASEVERVRPDIVHAQGLGPEGVAVAVLRDISTVITPHGHPRRDASLNRTGLKAFLEGYVRTLLAVAALRKASLCVAVGNEDSNLARWARRVVRVPNPVRREFFAGVDENTRRNGVLIPANVKPIKGIERVLQAATTVGIRGLTVAGAVEDTDYHADLSATARRLDLDVDWKGNLGPEALSTEYDRALMMVLGSDWEVTPVTIAEAMIRGCPVVAPDYAGIVEMLGHGDFGWLYRARDVEDLTRALREVLTEREEVSARCRTAQAHACREYDPVRIAQLIVGEYQLAAPNPKGVRS